MSATQYYTIRNQQVINETLDNETIIINLETGVYYSLNSTASLVWKGLSFGIPVHTISAQLADRHPEATDVEANVQKFITFLEFEQLIAATVAGNVDMDGFTNEVASYTKGYLPPAIEKYEDMQEMLLADPIHEVEEDGWPKMKK
jgi:hypothetical protein